MPQVRVANGGTVSTQLLLYPHTTRIATSSDTYLQSGAVWLPPTEQQRS
jgi:hypothetical protein